MNQLCVDLPAGQCQVAHAHRIRHISRLRLLLGDINLVIGSRIEDDFRVGGGQHSFDLFTIADIDGGALPTGNFITPTFEFANQLYAELSGTTENRCPARHKTRA